MRSPFECNRFQRQNEFSQISAKEVDLCSDNLPREKKVMGIKAGNS